MSNQAAVIPAAKAPLEIKEVETYTPGPRELLVKNEVIAFNPIESKIAKDAVFPVSYPSILGSSYGGTVVAVGPGVTNFKVGDRVASSRKSGVVGNQYGSHQKFVVASEETTSKVPDGIEVESAVSLMGNLTSAVGLFTGRAGLGKPVLNGTAKPTGKKVLVYGGTSNIGSLLIQYATHAGYEVVTTTSPEHEGYVSKLGAVKVIDHRQEPGAVSKALVAEGPYDLVIDSIAIPPTLAVTGAVMEAQGGGKVYALLPAFGPEVLPDGVTRVFEPWPTSLGEEKNAGLRDWAFATYIPQGLAKGKIIPQATEKVPGGLKGVSVALDRLATGVSGVKLVVHPWE